MVAFEDNMVLDEWTVRLIMTDADEGGMLDQQAREGIEEVP